jgi:hypothetical protein
MKKILLHIILVVLSPAFFSQELNWENFSGGIAINYLVADGDLNKNWSNTPEAGFLLNYTFRNNLTLEGSITGAFFKPKKEKEAASTSLLPDIILVNMPAGINYRILSNEAFSFHLSAGITNTTFIFTGDAAEILKENNVESEFGFYISTGLNRIIFTNITIEFTPAFQKIFSSPNLNFYRLGIKIIFDL